MSTLTLQVLAVSCQHCVRRITQALSALPGVQAVRVDLATKQIQVDYEGADVPECVRTTLEEIGYPPGQ